jgi:hypothetical protein
MNETPKALAGIKAGRLIGCRNSGIINVPAILKIPGIFGTWKVLTVTPVYLNRVRRLVPTSISLPTSPLGCRPMILD